MLQAAVTRVWLLVALEGVRDLLHGVRGFRQPTDRFQGLPADAVQDRTDDRPDEGDDDRRPAQTGR